MRNKLTSLIFGILGFLSAATGYAQSVPNLAMNNPDKQSWELFLHVVAGVTTQPTALGAFFETWATDTDTFQATPHWPQPTEVRPVSIRPRALLAVQALAVQRRLAQGAAATSGAGGTINCPQPPQPPNPIPPGTPPFCVAIYALVEDVFRNFVSFNFIVQNDLFQVSGLASAYAKVAATNKDITFPLDAIEVKTNWLPVDQLSNFLGPNVTPNLGSYHRRVITPTEGGNGRTYVLLSMHIMSKLVPNWTWATFEHQDNPGRCNIVGCRDSFGATQALVKPTSSADPDQTHYASCEKSAPLAMMFSAVPHDPAFANYCLKGSMSDFADQSGRAFVVGNSVTEQGFVSSSSCMGCHGSAATNSTGGDPNQAGFITNSVTNSSPAIGPIDPTLFWTNAPAGGKNTLPMVADQNEDMFPAKPESAGVSNEPLSPLNRLAIPVDFVWSIPFCAYNSTTKTAPCRGK